MVLTLLPFLSFFPLSERVHVPTPTTWCLAGRCAYYPLTPLKGRALDGSGNPGKNRDMRERLMQRTHQDSSLIIHVQGYILKRDNKGNHGPRRGEDPSVFFFFLRFYNVSFGLWSLVFSFRCVSSCFVTSRHWLWKCSVWSLAKRRMATHEHYLMVINGACCINYHSLLSL